VTVTVTTTPIPAPQTAAPQAHANPCSDDDLAVTNGPLVSDHSERHVTVSFRNKSTHSCTLFGYPGADLDTAAGGLMIHVPRRPADAAHLVTLSPGFVASADVSAHAGDTSTGDKCARWGNLVVTPPNDSVSHTMSVAVPICDATIGSVD
jgi:hypothetical protein